MSSARRSAGRGATGSMRRGRRALLPSRRSTAIPISLARVLAGRGVAPQEADLYLDPTLRRLMPDPSRLSIWMRQRSASRVAIEAGEKIAIFGDYDVDGAASSALLAEFFTAAGAPHLVYIPDRIFEGYGPNEEAIAANWPKPARSCSFASIAARRAMRLWQGRAELGLDTIVLDHHQAPEILPDAIVVNPNRQDDLSGLGQLCAAGVVFMSDRRGQSRFARPRFLERRAAGARSAPRPRSCGDWRRSPMSRR